MRSARLVGIKDLKLKNSCKKTTLMIILNCNPITEEGKSNYGRMSLKQNKISSISIEKKTIYHLIKTILFIGGEILINYQMLLINLIESYWWIISHCLLMQALEMPLEILTLFIIHGKKSINGLHPFHKDHWILS